MIDLFDILKNRKDKRINIRGEVAQDGLLFDIEYINELVDLILSNNDDVETKIFNVQEYRGQAIMSNYGMYTEAYEPEVKSIEFEIDINVTNAFYDKLEHLEDFIDYYTVGAIIYDHYIDESMITIDPMEEYMTLARRIENSERVLFDLNPAEEDWQIGSRPVFDFSHDADGDAVYASLFRPDPAEETGMFINSTLDFSRLD